MAPNTPQQNKRVEMDNRIIVKRAKSMIYETRVPKYLWTKVNKTVCDLNRTPTAKN